MALPTQSNTITPRAFFFMSRNACGASSIRYLWVTSETVKFHLSNIYRKLGVSNRADASQWALENGIVDQVPTVADDER